VRNALIVTGRTSRMWLGLGSVVRLPQTSPLGRICCNCTSFGANLCFRSVGDFVIAHCRHPLLGGLSRRFADSALLLTQLTASNLPSLKSRRISTLAHKPNFARYLRDARLKRGLSVAEVADEVGVSTSSIYFWETDHVRPRDANLSALCKVLKLPIRATREMAAG